MATHTIGAGEERAVRRGGRRAGLRASAVAAVLAFGALGAAVPAVAGASSHAASSSTLGRVTSVDASARTFTLRTGAGATVTVKVTAATAYKDSLVSSPSFADLRRGVSVAVVGTRTGSVETAVLVIIGGSGSSSSGGGSPDGFGGPGGFRGGTFGTVTAVDAKHHRFTVKTSSGKVTVTVTSSTTYRDRGSTKAGFKSLKVGEQVAVVGKKTAHGETARSVLVGGGFGGPGGFRGGTFGTVTAVDAKHHRFTVKTSSGKVTVTVTSSTTYRDRGSTKAGFKSLKVGEQVAVVGKKTAHGETARSVLVGFRPPPAG